MKSTYTILLLIFTLNCSNQNPVEFDLVISNVTLINGTGGAAQPNSNLFIKDGKIIDITEGDIAVSDEKVLDGTNKYLIPGLIDGHAHPSPAKENFPRFVHFGVTSIFVPGCGDCSNENYQSMRALSSESPLSSPRIFHTSQHFTMEGRHPVKTYANPKWVEGKTVYYVRDTLQIETLVREVSEQPILGIKVTIEDGPDPPFVERIPTEFVRKIVTEAHKYDLNVFAHVSDMEEVRIAEKAGADHIIHFVGVDIDWEKDTEVIDRLIARDVSWVTTIMIDKMFFYPAHPEWLEEIASWNIYDTAEIERLRSTKSAEEARAFLKMLYADAWDGLPDPTLAQVASNNGEDLQALLTKGCNLVIGTDTGNDFIFPGYSFHEEMEIMQMGGIEPKDIIKMATHNAAKMLGVLDELGTLEVGKFADMVLLEKNPLADIKNTLTIHSVFREGNLQIRIKEK